RSLGDRGERGRHGLMLVLLLATVFADATGALAGMKVVDLTHPISALMPTFDGKPEFSAEAEPGDDYYAPKLKLTEHTGTHVDAPAHFAKRRPTVDAIPAESLVAPAVVIDVRTKVADDAGYRLTAADLQAWEKKNGKIPFGAIVVAVTGWSRHWT